MTAHHLSNNSPGLPYTFWSHKFSRTNWFPVPYSEPFFQSLFSENLDSGPLHICETFYPVFMKINAFFSQQEGFLSPYPLNSFHTSSAIQTADTVHCLNEQNNWSLQNPSVKLLYNFINHYYTPLLQNKHVGQGWSNPIARRPGLPIFGVGQVKNHRKHAHGQVYFMVSLVQSWCLLSE